MSRSISREGFNELKNYLGVYLQQGRVILDSDWNENQDIAVSFLRRLNREALGEGSPNTGFYISPVIPEMPSFALESLDTSGMDKKQAKGAVVGAFIQDLFSAMLYLLVGPILFFLSFPGEELEGFESLQGWLLNSSQGKLRIGRDRPYAGNGFLRLSGHAGTVTLTKTLPQLKDLSAHDLVTFRYRMSAQVPGTMKFFVEDSSGNRSVWLCGVPAFAKGTWQSSFAAPLDLRFRILTTELPNAVVGKSYSATAYAIGGTTPIVWSLAGAPGGLSISANSDTHSARLSWSAPVAGTYTFTVKAKDATNTESTKSLTLLVKASGSAGIEFPDTSTILSSIRKFEIPTGTPADLTRIKKYGFELYQDTTTPLVWDLDDMRLGSSAQEKANGENNFIIRGSDFSTYQNNLTLISLIAGAASDGSGGGSGGGGSGSGNDDDALLNYLEVLNSDFMMDQPSIENAGRYYVAGLPVVQLKDELYSQQADPNDPPLAPPAAGVTRKDEVYLDVWTEPVTYVQDPQIREIALGGPDTSTRLRVRHRVRVAQGGQVPKGNGIGGGTLATEGTYTAQANRLYRVQVDTAGNLGTATFRWSEDNASTVQRIIEPLPPGSTKVVVEDASAFHPGERVLISKEFGEEEHQIATVFGNVITLQQPTGAQLALLPAAARVPQFTTFALSDRPMLQRWNAFKVPVLVDPDDPTISRAIELNDGVKVRFGGEALHKGDYWNFQTRYLAGDEALGIDPETRIEQLAFQRARGPVHHYVPLATLTRNGSAAKPKQISTIQDRRHHVGNGGSINFAMPDPPLISGTGATEHLGGFQVPPSTADSKYVMFWSGDVIISGSLPADPAERAKVKLTIKAAFYDDTMTDPETDEDTGQLMDTTLPIFLAGKSKGVEVPVQLVFNMSSSPCAFLPLPFVPTSIQFFAELSHTGITVQLLHMRATILELRKSY